MDTNSKGKSDVLVKVALLTFAGIFFITISSGIRNNYGIMLNAIIAHTGIPIASMSLILGVGQFVYGLVQPLFGILAAKKGNRYALVSGVFITAAGLILTPFSNSMFTLMLCLGIILPTGTGILSYGIIIGTIAPKIPAKMVISISGLVNASVGLGNILMSPLVNALIESGGFMYGMHMLAIPVIVSLPIAFFLGKNDRDKTGDVKAPAPQAAAGVAIKTLFADALKSRTYRYLMAGFFTCGFHMALVINHLPAEFVAQGFSPESAAFAFSIFGVTTIAGSVLSGIFCSKLKMKNVLGFLYGLRPLTILLFLLMPRTLASMTLFTALLGFSGASTVPPVSGTVGKIFGATSIAMLYGLVFVVHQIGAFFSAWLAGICFYLTGSYTPMWIAALTLGLFASVISFAIREQKG